MMRSARAELGLKRKALIQVQDAPRAPRGGSRNLEQLYAVKDVFSRWFMPVP